MRARFFFHSGLLVIVLGTFFLGDPLKSESRSLFEQSLRAFVEADEAETPSDSIFYVPIPLDVDRQAVFGADAELKDRLHRHLVEALRAEARPLGHENSRDRVVILLDHRGEPMVPDREAAALRSSQSPLASDNELTFTYESPGEPWTEEELSTLDTLLGDFYPEAQDVFGPPAFDLIVNVRKVTTINSYYNASLNEMVVKSPIHEERLCRAMLQAFRDDFAAGPDIYGTAMVRAAEMEVFARLPDYTHWDAKHDSYFESHNTPAVATKDGSYLQGALVGTRSVLAIYAWIKVHIEYPDFFFDFNREYYLQVLDDPTTRTSAAKLRAIATSLLSNVEGEPFQIWYEKQHVFNTDPDPGCFLHLQPHSSWVQAYCRDDNGTETEQVGTPIQWAIHDYQGTLVHHGSCVTGPGGGCNISPSSFVWGRAEYVVTATIGGSTLRESAFRGVYDHPGEKGIWGVVATENSGTVAITPDGEPPVVLNVEQGIFASPSLGGFRGQFTAVFQGENGTTATRTITKDSGGYFVHFPEPSVPACTASTEPCEPSTTILCLDGDPGDRRFEAKVRWATNLGGGSAGDASVVELDSVGVDQGGLFYFFQRGNPEVLLKILDGCAINQHYWIFASPGTTLGTIITVRDTATGCEKTYINGDNAVAFPIADPLAFATCP